MSHEGEPGHPGHPGEPGSGGGGPGGTGGEGGRGGAGVTTITKGARYAVVFLFLFSLTLAAANVLFTARQVGHVRALTTAAARNAASIRQLCLAGNEARAQQVTLWDHVITITLPPPRETPAQRRHRLAAERAFEAYVHRVFAPRDCSRPLTLTR